jgi:hypothetical protein
VKLWDTVAYPLPSIDTFVITGDNLSEIDGHGAPGYSLGVWWDKRGCIQGNLSASCPMGSNHLSLTPRAVVVGADGRWKLTLANPIKVTPTSSQANNCTGAELNQFTVGPANESNTGHWNTCPGRLRDVGDPPQLCGPPVLNNFNIVSVGGSKVAAPTDVELAYQAGVVIADGPDASDAAQNSVNVCVLIGDCGSDVAFALTGGTLLAPSAIVQDNSTITGARDNEFPYIFAMMQARAPGGSTLAVIENPRPTPLGPTVNVNVSGTVRVDVNVDASIGFSFF